MEHEHKNEHRRQVSAKKRADDDPYSPGPQSPLATVRDAVPYDTSQPATVQAATGYGSFVILLPIPDPGTTPPHNWDGRWYKRALYGTAEAGPVTFVPPDPRVIIIDYMDGFEPTPVNLHYYANWFETHFEGGAGTPGGTPVVT
jgi:hypothetical protein